MLSILSPTAFAEEITQNAETENIGVTDESDDNESVEISISEDENNITDVIVEDIVDDEDGTVITANINETVTTADEDNDGNAGQTVEETTSLSVTTSTSGTEDSINLYVDSVCTVSLTHGGSGGSSSTSRTYTITNSDSSVATVSTTSLTLSGTTAGIFTITGVSAGTTTVTGTYSGNTGDYTFTIDVTVYDGSGSSGDEDDDSDNNDDQTVEETTSLSVTTSTSGTEDSIDLYVDSVCTVSLTHGGSGGSSSTSRTYTITNSDSSVATVSTTSLTLSGTTAGTFTITGVSAGTTTITGAYSGTSGSYTFTINVTVYDSSGSSSDDGETTETVYVLTDTLTVGEDYLIVSADSGTGYALKNDSGSVSSTVVTILTDDDGTVTGLEGNTYIADVSDSFENELWNATAHINSSYSGYPRMINAATYALYPNSSTLSLSSDLTSTSGAVYTRYWTYSNNTLAAVSTNSGSTTYYMTVSDSTFGLSSSAESSIYLYQKTSASSSDSGDSSDGGSTESGSANIVFGSDIHTNTSTFNSIISVITNAGVTLDAGVFLGDYSNGSTSSDSSTTYMTAMKETMDGINAASYFIQGNHDVATSSLMTISTYSEMANANDYLVYGVNYSSMSDSAAVTALDTYLSGLVDDGETRPVFIVFHPALHYTSGSDSGRNLPIQESYVTTINEYGDDLDIVVLHGHNHTVDTTLYYLTVGDTITTTTSSSGTATYTLNFTYLTAGYVNATSTMTVATISDESITMTRYTTSGAGSSYTIERQNSATSDTHTHTYGTPTFTWAEDYSTCTATFTCTVCGETTTEECTVTSETTDATCTEDGETIYTATATLDDTEYSNTQTVTIEAAGHTEGETVSENEVAATCTTNGSYDSVVYCTVCGEELSRETLTVLATGHNYEAIVTEPTCTESGYTTYTCTVCGDSYVADETEATGHTWDEGVVTTEPTTSSEGVRTYTCTVCGETKTETIDMVVFAIVTHPADAEVTVGDSATFSVTATGTDLTYQWQYQTASGTKWYNCSGTTSETTTTSSISVTAYSFRDGYKYRCVVTNGDGQTLTSNQATLTIAEIEVLTITASPESVSVSKGSSVSFSVTATSSQDETLTYQWQYKTASGSSWYNCTAATGEGYDTSSVTLTANTGRNGYQYRCKVSDESGNVVYSDVASLTVTAAEAITITAQPENVTAVNGDSATFTVKATSNLEEELTYQWQFMTTSGSKWYNCTSTTGEGYTTSSVTLTANSGRDGYKYRCKITDESGNIVYSEYATLTVTSATD